ncbi:hypothetical protein B0H14DRAFT_956529 [Mycena olivaceomarginata]|nr:hypothetical protein B0H14DRAFT_956529 [Mycena olivaceomarginata]
MGSRKLVRGFRSQETSGGRTVGSESNSVSSRLQSCYPFNASEKICQGALHCGFQPSDILSKSGFVPFSESPSGSSSFFRGASTSGQGSASDDVGSSPSSDSCGASDSSGASDSGGTSDKEELVEYFPQSTKSYHPGCAINEYLLSSTADAMVAVTHDEEWMSLLNEDDEEIPQDCELVRRISYKYNIEGTADGVWLTMLNEGASNPEARPQLTDLIPTASSVILDEAPDKFFDGGELQQELERTREEKETLAAQYRNLLAKMTSMGNKLEQDTEELDRREVLVQQLQAQNDEPTSTMEMPKEELVSTSAEAQRASGELDNMRSEALKESVQESLVRERELRETQTELEQCRTEKYEWERTALQERVLAAEARSNAELYRRALELEWETRKRDAPELESEWEISDRLQFVLQDFETWKDHKRQQAANPQLARVTQLLTAELRLKKPQTNTSQMQELEKEVKQTLLDEKLRHEAIIMNEHLTMALHRLQNHLTEPDPGNIDCRLVTNTLLSFLTTPHTDPKRFEMLSLLASFLSWSDREREKAGLPAQVGPRTRKSWAAAHAVPHAVPAAVSQPDRINESVSEQVPAGGFPACIAQGERKEGRRRILAIFTTYILLHISVNT